MSLSGAQRRKLRRRLELSANKCADCEEPVRYWHIAKGVPDLSRLRRNQAAWRHHRKAAHVMSPVPPALWHFTTPATFAALGEVGMLHPAVHLVTAKDLPRSPLNRAENMAKQLIWLTDLDSLNCAALRLHPGQLYHRYLMAPGGPPVTPWRLVRAGWPPVIVEELESEGTEPDHWYVTRGPVPVIYSSYDYC